MFTVLFFVSWLACAFFCSNVAKEKGYSSSSWFFGGFFFGFFALIALLALPDKKLRKYLLQLGIKQDGRTSLNLDEEEELDFDNKQKIIFQTSKDAKEEDIYKQLLSKIDDEVIKNILIRSIVCTEIEDGGFGFFEFRCKDKDGNYLLILRSKKLKDNQIEWKGTF